MLSLPLQYKHKNLTLTLLLMFHSTNWLPRSDHPPKQVEIILAIQNMYINHIATPTEKKKF